MKPMILRRLVVALLLISTPVQAALTTTARLSTDISVVYADQAQTGSGHAGSKADPFSYADIPAGGGPSIITYIRGDGTNASTLTLTAGTAGSGAAYIGTDAAWVPITNPYDANISVLTSTVSGSSITTGAHTLISGIHVNKNGASGDAFASTAGPTIYFACLGENAGTYAFDPVGAGNTGTKVIACVGRYSGSENIDGSLNVTIYMSEFYGGSSYGATTGAQSDYIMSWFYDNDDDGILVSASSAGLFNNAFHANGGSGMKLSGDNNAALFNGASGNTAFGVEFSGATGANHGWIGMTGYYGNAAETNLADPNYGMGEVYGYWSNENPDYVAPATVPPNYATANAEYLEALALVIASQGLNAGPWQGAPAATTARPVFNFGNPAASHNKMGPTFIYNRSKP